MEIFSAKLITAENKLLCIGAYSRKSRLQAQRGFMIHSVMFILQYC